jgi:hypothetical protein
VEWTFSTEDPDLSEYKVIMIGDSDVSVDVSVGDKVLALFEDRTVHYKYSSRYETEDGAEFDWLSTEKAYPSTPWLMKAPGIFRVIYPNGQVLTMNIN